MSDAITARQLSRRFGDLLAVDGLNLSVARGSVHGFLGPNGSGKSTTIRMLAGLLMPSSGDIEVLGQKLPAAAEAVRRRMGYMTQKFSLYEDLSVRENLEFLAHIHGLYGAKGRHRVNELLSRYHLDSRQKQLAGTLSGGEKQRLALAGAVLHEPELLLLDEPTSQVDPQSRRDFWDALFDLADAGTSLLVSTHYMDEAERCHRLAILDHGRLVAEGTPQKLIESLPFVVVRLHAERPRAIQQVLTGIDGVSGIAQLGASLRVLLRRDLDRDTLLHRLGQQGFAVQMEVIGGNLEDVFVAATSPGGRS